MTRRQRHINILKNFGRVGQYDRDGVLHRMGLDAFTDEAIEAMAVATVSGWRASEKRNAAYRDALATRHQARS